MRQALAFAVWLALPPAVQDPASPVQPAVDALLAAERELTKALEEAATAAEPRAARRTLLAGFVAAFGTAHRDAPAVLAARCRLGSLLLTDLATEGARREFEAVLANAPVDDRDLRGRALYGLAQALELAGEELAAREVLQRAATEVDGTRYARFASIALERLDARAPVQSGMPAPAFGPRLDVEGKPRQLEDLAGRPALLLFVSLVDPAGLEELRDLLAAAGHAGLQPEQIVLFALHGEARDATTVAVRQQWHMPVLLCEREFLDPDLLRYGVRALPAALLIGPDGTLLARDPTPRRITDALAAIGTR